MLTLEDIRQSIREDIQEGLDVEIIEECDSFVRIYDNTEMTRELTIHDPMLVNRGWILDRILETPSAKTMDYRVNLSELAMYLADRVEPEFMTTMNALVILGDVEEDDEWLRTRGEWGCELEGSDLPYDELGIMWWAYGKVFVNMGRVIEGVRQLVEEGLFDEWEEMSEVNIGMLSTIVHEIRHLAQANPYIPDEVLCQHSDDETDAESYALNVVGYFPPCMVYSTKGE